MSAKYLDFKKGINTAYLTSIYYNKSDGDKRAEIALRFCEQPTEVTHTAPFTNVKLKVPHAGDESGTKILFEGKMKSLLYPLVGFKPEQKCKLGDLFSAIKESLVLQDIECELVVSEREGNQIDSKTGANRIFTEVDELDPKRLIDKKPYESDIEFEDLSEAGF